MIDDLIVKAVFPQLTGTTVQSIDVRDGTVEIGAVTACASAPCPVCGVTSTRVHGGYDRRLRDLGPGRASPAPPPGRGCHSGSARAPRRSGRTRPHALPGTPPGPGCRTRRGTP